MLENLNQSITLTLPFRKFIDPWLELNGNRGMLHYVQMGLPSQRVKAGDSSVPMDAHYELRRRTAELLTSHLHTLQQQLADSHEQHELSNYVPKPDMSICVEPKYSAELRHVTLPFAQCRQPVVEVVSSAADRVGFPCAQMVADYALAATVATHRGEGNPVSNYTLGRPGAAIFSSYFEPKAEPTLVLRHEDKSMNPLNLGQRGLGLYIGRRGGNPYFGGLEPIFPQDLDAIMPVAETYQSIMKRLLQHDWDKHDGSKPTGVLDACATIHSDMQDTLNPEVIRMTDKILRDRMCRLSPLLSDNTNIYARATYQDP